jgi:hypothetical protein
MLKEFLNDKRESILKEWLEQTFNSYEPEMVRFLKKEKNQFANPVRNTIVTSLERILDGFLSENEVQDGLEEIVKVRAIQDFSPSQALSFLFGLKKIILGELIRNEQKTETLEEIYNLDQRFDTLLRQAFDYYNDCRMKIQEIKISEIKSRSERAFEILKKKRGL